MLPLLADLVIETSAILVPAAKKGRISAERELLNLWLCGKRTLSTPKCHGSLSRIGIWYGGREPEDKVLSDWDKVTTKKWLRTRYIPRVAPQDVAW